MVQTPHQLQLSHVHLAVSEVAVVEDAEDSLATRRPSVTETLVAASTVANLPMMDPVKTGKVIEVAKAVVETTKVVAEAVVDADVVEAVATGRTVLGRPSTRNNPT